MSNQQVHQKHKPRIRNKKKLVVEWISTMRYHSAISHPVHRMTVAKWYQHFNQYWSIKGVVDIFNNIRYFTMQMNNICSDTDIGTFLSKDTVKSGKANEVYFTLDTTKSKGKECNEGKILFYDIGEYHITVFIMIQTD